jgi:hypothetical protein
MNANCRSYNGYKTLLITVTLLLYGLLSPERLDGQQVSKEVPPLSERIFYGGSFGLQFGSITNIQVSPVVGLWVRPRLTVAVGPEYTYYKDPGNATSIYGANVYTQFFVIQDLNNVVKLGLHYGFFAMAEDELLSLKSSFWKDPPFNSDRFYTNTFMVGGGISQPLGQRSAINLMVLWPLEPPQYGFYSNPEIRFNFIF